jgi:hypothetical protein
MSRKNHLLLNSETLMLTYAKEVAKVVEFLTTQIPPHQLLIFTFEEGSAILIKSF